MADGGKRGGGPRQYGRAAQLTELTRRSSMPQR